MMTCLRWGSWVRLSFFLAIGGFAGGVEAATLGNGWNSAKTESGTPIVTVSQLPADRETLDGTLTDPSIRPLDIERIPPEPEPEVEPLPRLPQPEELLGPPATEPAPSGEDFELSIDEETITVERFEVVGSTVFSDEELAEVTAPFTNRSLTFAEVLQVRSAITQLYVERGYITSGAVVPPQTYRDGGVVEIRAIEGGLDEIKISGNRRLRPGYIRSRIKVGISTPLNIDRLLERLQVLQLNPLVENISADLQAGTQPGSNVLAVTVTEANSFDLSYSFDNNRVPSVGTFRHDFRITEGNLFGFGDRVSVGYRFTEGSDEVDFDYTLPVNGYDGSLRFVTKLNDNEVIEDPFDVLDIESDTELYELTFRQPVVQTPTRDVVLGLTASHQSSQSFLGIDDIGPFPLSPGADERGARRFRRCAFFRNGRSEATNR